MNAGRVELDLVAVGKDQVSAMLRTIEGQAKKTADGMKATGNAATDFGAKVDAIKGKAAGVNKLRDAFENLSSNAGFVIGAVTGVGLALAGLVEQFDSGAQAIKAWEATQANVVGYLEKTRDLVEDIDVLLGRAPKTELAKTAEAAFEQWEKNKNAINDAEAALSAYEIQIKELARQYTEFSPIVMRLQDERTRAQNAYNDLLKDQNTLQAGYLRLLDEEKRKRSEPYGPPLPEEKDPGSWDPNAETMNLGVVDGRSPRRGGGGGPKRELAAQRGDFFGQTRQASDRFAVDAGVAENAKRVLWEDPPADFWAQDGLGKMATQAEQFAEALTKVADATGLVATSMPEMGSALSEIEAITAKVVEGKLSLANALAAGATAIAANAAKAIGGVRAEAAVRAAYEIAMGFATLANPFESAGHFTAGALLGAVAAGAGGGGGGRGKGGGGGGASGGNGGGSSGPTTIVNNFSMGIGDRQTIMQAQRQAERSSRGTGIGARSGV